jgi:hypothetical protein
MNAAPTPATPTVIKASVLGSGTAVLQVIPAKAGVADRIPATSTLTTARPERRMLSGVGISYTLLGSVDPTGRSNCRAMIET